MENPTRHMTLPEWEQLLPDDAACKAYLIRRRWPEGVRCRLCGSDSVWELKCPEWSWVRDTELQYGSD